MEIFGVSMPAMMSQLLLGLVNGSFYAILSLGLAVIFGLLNVIKCLPMVLLQRSWAKAVCCCPLYQVVP